MTHTTTVPVTWGDTDAGGLIYYPRFFHFVVVGLNDYFGAERHLMDSLREDGHVLPAVEASGSFASPLRAGQTARLETTVTDAGETSLSVAVDVERAADGEHAAALTGTFVLVDEAFEPAALPAEVTERVVERGDGAALE